MSETLMSPVSLCGFDRCQEPLPAPGPRGGRPFEFCPDRTWPGGKTCKQLAAAQEALREALGQPADAPALTAAASTLSGAVDRFLEPVRAVWEALEAVNTTTTAELAAAATQVQEATAAAAHERGLRQAAEQRADQAHADTERAHEALQQAQATAAQAEEQARQDQAAAEQARSAAQDARVAREQTETALARADALATAEATRADTAVRDAQTERRRAETATRDLATATERVSVLTAERDGARTALDELRATSGDTERRLRDDLAAAHVAADAARTRLADVDTQLREALTVHHQQLTTEREQSATAREQLAVAQQQAQLSHQRHHRELHAHRTRLRSLRGVLLDRGVTDQDLRTRLLAVLLDMDAEPGDDPAVGTGEIA